MYQTLRYEKQENIGILTINRPEALNALNSTVIGDLEQAITEVEKDAELGALIITGEGHSDRQTLMGKLPERVMRRAQTHHVPTWLVAGQALDAEPLLQAGFSRVDSLTPDGMPLEEAIRPEVARENIGRWVERNFPLN